MMLRVWYLLAITVVLQLQCVSRTSATIDDIYDGTLMPNRSGASVVRAVIAKIFASEIFNESQWYDRRGDRAIVMIFLRRMAYVETRDGLDSRPAAGGIWGIRREQFNRTNTRVCGSSDEAMRMRQIIKESILNIDWCTISYDGAHDDNDMPSVPMYSGLAVALRLDELIRVENIMLPTINKLHKLWEHFGRPEMSQKWRRGVNELEMKEKCSIKSDVVFVIDSSISITPRDYRLTNTLVCDFSKELSRSADNSIGVILIGSQAVEQKLLGEILTQSNKNSTIKTVCNLPHLEGFTNTADGLCTLSRQQWRENDAGVLKLAIVITDGESNSNSENCDGNSTEEMARLMRTSYSDVLVLAVGVGQGVNEQELSTIASRSHLTSHVMSHGQLGSMSETLHYQICSTMSTPTSSGEEANGALTKNEIMRWVLEGVSSKGATVRLCVKEGSITLYVSQIATPNEEMYDRRSTITGERGIGCATIFSGQYRRPGTRRQRRSQQEETGSLYLSVEGLYDINTFFLQSGDGNVTFDVNECKQQLSPCHESAVCHNTDGNFYCECRTGYRGDGFECSSHLLGSVTFLLPSVVTGAFLLLFLVLLAIVGICLNCRTSKDQPNQNNLRRPTSFKAVNGRSERSISATNPLTLSTSIST